MFYISVYLYVLKVHTHTHTHRGRLFLSSAYLLVLGLYYSDYHSCHTVLSTLWYQNESKLIVFCRGSRDE